MGKAEERRHLRSSKGNRGKNHHIGLVYFASRETKRGKGEGNSQKKKGSEHDQGGERGEEGGVGGKKKSGWTD